MSNVRYGALDAMRGLTLALMIIVNTPGSWSHVYPPLLHAQWHGWTFTDLVFPFFLFIVGAALFFSGAASSQLSTLVKKSSIGSLAFWGLSTPVLKVGADGERPSAPPWAMLSWP